MAQEQVKQPLLKQVDGATDMPETDEERRRAPRYKLVAPVQLKDGSTGQTLDMSTCGIFFETDHSCALGETLRFAVVLKESTVQCQGTVVRLQPREFLFGIAVELDLYEFA